ncbi:CoA transferase [Blastomonas sp.]|uniref:CoA transferase n=1 Tax=Blastomonas sp. TaxID=1909299 RepID=UPI00260989D4|nr:CoA transferase [Blastomonas sp.]MDM7956662.1 CoA transferase [Blastomonas sp.]
MTAALFDHVAATGVQLAEGARQIGGRISIDPGTVLHRDRVPPLAEPGRISANGHCRLIEAQDGWLAVNLPRDEDRLSVPAWTQCDVDAEPWQAVEMAARQGSATDILERAELLHLPVARVGETMLCARAPLRRRDRPRREALSAIDLSALWAGPLCGGLLADAGIATTRVESPARPDPTARTSPELHGRINGNKRCLSMSIADPALTALIAAADVLITSGRAHALARIGLSPERLFALNPDLIWVAITAHGWLDSNAMRVGFGDDCAAAGGLVALEDGCPSFVGDALADPLTGLLAAKSALDALASDNVGLIDVSLAQSAAHFANLMEIS